MICLLIFIIFRIMSDKIQKTNPVIVTSVFDTGIDHVTIRYLRIHHSDNRVITSDEIEYLSYDNNIYVNAADVLKYLVGIDPDNNKIKTFLQNIIKPHQIHQINKIIDPEADQTNIHETEMDEYYVCEDSMRTIHKSINTEKSNKLFSRLYYVLWRE